MVYRIGLRRPASCSPSRSALSGEGLRERKSSGCNSGGGFGAAARSGLYSGRARVLARLSVRHLLPGAWPLAVLPEIGFENRSEANRVSSAVSSRITSGTCPSDWMRRPSACIARGVIFSAVSGDSWQRRTSPCRTSCAPIRCRDFDPERTGDDRSRGEPPLTADQRTCLTPREPIQRVRAAGEGRTGRGLKSPSNRLYAIRGDDDGSAAERAEIATAPRAVARALRRFEHEALRVDPAVEFLELRAKSSTVDPGNG